MGENLVVDRGELGRVMGGDIGQVAGARMKVRLLGDDLVALVEGEKLEGDIEPAGEIRFQPGDLLG